MLIVCTVSMYFSLLLLLLLLFFFLLVGRRFVRG